MCAAQPFFVPRSVMALLKIARMGHPVLLGRAEEVADPTAPEIRRLADAFLQNPKTISVAKPATVAATITTGVVLVREHDKREALRRLIRREEVQNAVTLFEAALRIDPDNIQANVGLAQALIHVLRSRWDPERAKVLARAEEAATRATAVAPDHAQAQSVKAEILGLQKRFDAALATYDRAIEALEKRGYDLVQINWYCASGEIDAVMWDGEELVFLEVKARTGNRRGNAEEALTPAKLRKLATSAEWFLSEHPELGDPIWRIDLVAITLDSQGEAVRFSHITNVAAVE